MKIENIMLVAVVLVAGTLVWGMFTDQREHAGRHEMKTSVADFRLEIQLLEELVKKDPDNYQAWRELGKRYSSSIDFIKAREAWDKSLEISPTGENTEKIKRMIDHMENGYDPNSHNRHNKVP